MNLPGQPEQPTAQQDLTPESQRRRAAMGAVACVLGLLVVVVLIRWWQDESEGEAPPREHRATRLELEKTANERLAAYGWVDREKGIVHVPVEQAIQAFLEERRSEAEDAGG